MPLELLLGTLDLPVVEAVVVFVEVECRQEVQWSGTLG